jgi:V-type H+-transporting ATPase subunit a
MSKNELAFVNSLKMKMSVIIGVLQMLFGVLLKCLNAIHFGNKLDLIFECLPQVFFMSFLFGYMDVLIYLKWSQDWTQGINKGKGAPSIITEMMNFIVGGAKVVKLSFIYLRIFQYGVLITPSKFFTILSY